MKVKVYNCSLDERYGYVFMGDKIKVVDKKTCLLYDATDILDIDTNRILEDASKAYIKNDIYSEGFTPFEEQEACDDLCSCDGYCGDCKCNPCECDDLSKGVVEVEDDVAHHLGAKDFGDYLIVIGDYGDQDFDIFTGTKEDLNKHIAELHLHIAPKVYALKQLQVKTKYEVL